MRNSIQKPPKREPRRLKKRNVTPVMYRKSPLNTSLLNHYNSLIASKDGKNMAILLANMQSGINTFQKVWLALEDKFPFHKGEFQKSFREAL